MSRLFHTAAFSFLVFCVSPLMGFSQQKEAIDVRIDLNKTYQTISNFAASDAWSCQFVGNWPDAAKNTIADWLFSMDTLANGNPKGIGLSLWRFNIGAGSAQQGNNSGIRDEWRRAASFIEKDSDNRQQAQLWFLKAAKQRGVQQFLGFFNSPPVSLTANGKAFAEHGQCNISNDHFNDFAQYAVNVLKSLQTTARINPEYISPVNEPQWDWSDGGQEGCPYTNVQISGVVKAFNAAFLKNKVAAKIIMPESGSNKYLLEDGDKPGRGNQVNAFFNPASANYVGNLPNVQKVIASHSYFTTSPFTEATALRKKLAQAVEAVNGLIWWQSEYCILGDNAGEMNGSGRDLGMNAALYLARCIHTDLVAGNAAAWQWWLAISPYNYKDGLIYIDKNKSDGKYYDSKMLWAFGNYSRFVRPGMKRVEVPATNSEKVLVSAFKDEHKKKLVIVVINNSTDEQELAIAGAGNNRWNVYTTSSTANLEKQIWRSNHLKISPQTVVTLETNY